MVRNEKIVMKAAIAGGILTLLDYLFHILYANPETLGYFVYKFILAAGFAYLFFTGKANFLKVREKSIEALAYYGAFFAVAHGFYYRLLDIYQGNPFFARVGDIHLFGLDVSASNFIQISLAWLVVHGGFFIIAVMIADRIAEMIN